MFPELMDVAPKGYEPVGEQIASASWSATSASTLAPPAGAMRAVIRTNATGTFDAAGAAPQRWSATPDAGGTAFARLRDRIDSQFAALRADIHDIQAKLAAQSVAKSSSDSEFSAQDLLGQNKSSWQTSGPDQLGEVELAEALNTIADVGFLDAADFVEVAEAGLKSSSAALRIASGRALAVMLGKKAAPILEEALAAEESFTARKRLQAALSDIPT